MLTSDKKEILKPIVSPILSPGSALVLFYGISLKICYVIWSQGSVPMSWNYVSLVPRSALNWYIAWKAYFWSPELRSQGPVFDVNWCFSRRPSYPLFDSELDLKIKLWHEFLSLLEATRSEKKEILSLSEPWPEPRLSSYFPVLKKILRKANKFCWET